MMGNKKRSLAHVSRSIEAIQRSMKQSLVLLALSQQQRMVMLWAFSHWLVNTK